MTKFLIGVAGTHSTGKSSFCKELSENLLTLNINVSIVPSFGKLASELKIPLLTDHTYQSTYWFITKTLESKNKQMESSDVVIVDRPEIDSLAYWKAALEYNKKICNPEEMTEIETLILENSKIYSHLFATKLDPLIPLGPGRDDDLKFREMVDFHLHDSIKLLPNKFMILESYEYKDHLLILQEEIITSLRN